MQIRGLLEANALPIFNQAEVHQQAPVINWSQCTARKREGVESRFSWRWAESPSGVAQIGGTLSRHSSRPPISHVGLICFELRSSSFRSVAVPHGKAPEASSLGRRATAAPLPAASGPKLPARCSRFCQAQLASHGLPPPMIRLNC